MSLSSDPAGGNLTAAGVRSRRLSGSVAIAAGLLVTALLLGAGRSPLWFALVFALHLFGFLGVLQAREKT